MVLTVKTTRENSSVACIAMSSVAHAHAKTPNQSSQIEGAFFGALVVRICKKRRAREKSARGALSA